MTTANQETPIKKIFYKALRFMLIADIVQSMQEMMLDFFISRHLGSNGLAAFGIAYPLIMFIMALMAWVVTGVQAICARDIGDNDNVNAHMHLCTGLTWGVIIMLVFTLLCWAFHYPLITALGATDEYAYLRNASTDALLVGSLTGPFLCTLVILLTNLFFNEKRKFMVVLGLSTIFVQFIITAIISGIYPTMAGIWGGYVISLAVSDAIILVTLRICYKNKTSMFYHIRPMFRFDGVSASLKIGLPELLCWGYYILSATLRNGIILRISNEDDLAAVTLSDGAEFGELLQTAAFYAVLVTIGMAVGSKDREKYRIYVSSVAKSILKIALIGGITMMLIAWPILNLFIEEGESQAVFDIALKILIIYGFNFIFYLLNNMFSSLYETIGLIKYAHLNYILEVVLYSMLMLVLGYNIGIDAFWFAQPLAEILVLFFNLGLAWKSCGHFPRSFTDLSFDKALSES